MTVTYPLEHWIVRSQDEGELTVTCYSARLTAAYLIYKVDTFPSGTRKINRYLHKPTREAALADYITSMERAVESGRKTLERNERALQQAMLLVS